MCEDVIFDNFDWQSEFLITCTYDFIRVFEIGAPKSELPHPTKIVSAPVKSVDVNLQNKIN